MTAVTYLEGRPGDHRGEQECILISSTAESLSQMPAWRLCRKQLRPLTTWHCPHSATARRCCWTPGAGRAAIDGYFLPAGPTAANPQQPVCCRVTDKRTDRRTDTAKLHRPLSERRISWGDNSSANKLLTRHKKVKVAHTRLPSVGFRSWSRFLTVSLQVSKS